MGVPPLLSKFYIVLHVGLCYYLYVSTNNIYYMNIKPRKPLSYYKYGKHKRDATQRGIEFNLTLEEWRNWWVAQGVDKDIQQPLNANTLCMCRFNDQGPYALDNIYCATLSQNQKDARKFNPDYGKTRSKPFRTPIGDFPSKRDALKSLGITIRNLEKLMRNHPNDFYYL